MTIPLVLASNSPRRRELLRQIGLSFSVDPADVDETMLPGEKPGEFAVRVAVDKARVAAGRAGQAVIVAADTIVVVDDEVLGKPVDRDDAVRMLSRLSGRDHRVITGLAIIDAQNGRVASASAVTQVWFRTLAAHEIAAYVASGEPLDKAGAYGIQEKGALFVERIDGCYFNVVGLPLALLGSMLQSFDVRLWG